MEEAALDPFKKAGDDDSGKKLLRNHLKKIIKICVAVQKLEEDNQDMCSSPENSCQLLLSQKSKLIKI